MVKNNRMEFRVTNEMKENFTLKANSLNVNCNKLFEILCNFDIGLYGRDLKRIKDLLNNEKAKNLCDNSNKEISGDEK